MIHSLWTKRWMKNICVRRLRHQWRTIDFQKILIHRTTCEKKSHWFQQNVWLSCTCLNVMKLFIQRFSIHAQILKDNRNWQNIDDFERSRWTRWIFTFYTKIMNGKELSTETKERIRWCVWFLILLCMIFVLTFFITRCILTSIQILS